MHTFMYKFYSKCGTILYVAYVWIRVQSKSIHTIQFIRYESPQRNGKTEWMFLYPYIHTHITLSRISPSIFFLFFSVIPCQKNSIIFSLLFWKMCVPLCFSFSPKPKKKKEKRWQKRNSPFSYMAHSIIRFCAQPGTHKVCVYEYFTLAKYINLSFKYVSIPV